MSLLKVLDPILEAWLPTKWSRWTVGATILLAVFSTRLPEFLPLLGYEILEKYRLLTQIFVPTLICLIGTFVVLSLVVRHSKLLTKQIGTLERDLVNQNETHCKEIAALTDTHLKESEEIRKSISELSIQPLKTPAFEKKYFVTGGYKWEAKVFRSGYFELNDAPICLTHDLKFISGSAAKYCPGTGTERCNQKIYFNDEYKIFESAKSVIEREIRNGGS